MVFHTAKEVLEVEKTREDPTVEAVQNYELFRRSNFLSEPAANFEIFLLMQAQLDRQLREFNRIGRGLEYKFDSLAFHSVVVGFLYRSKRGGKKKKITWSKTPRFFNGRVGPLVWTIGCAAKYVVFFTDNDRGRFGVDEISKFLVGSLEGVALEMNIEANMHC